MPKHRDLHRIRIRCRTAPQHTQNPPNDHQPQGATNHTNETFHFHQLRPGERWISDDLDGYLDARVWTHTLAFGISAEPGR